MKVKSKMQKKREEVSEPGSESDGNLNEQQEMETDEEENVSENDEKAGPSGSLSDEPSEKKKKRGIIYISSIPKFMNVTILRELLSQYAKLGRIFLQPGKLSGKCKILVEQKICILIKVAPILIHQSYFQFFSGGRKSKEEKASPGAPFHRRLGRIRKQTCRKACRSNVKQHTNRHTKKFQIL